MPTYEFKCPKCGARDEIEETMADIGEAIVLCIEDSCWDGPDGEGVKMKRVFTAPRAIFKGSGFYSNDSRPKPKTEAKPKEKKTDGA